MSNEENEHHGPEPRKPGRTEPEIRYIPIDMMPAMQDNEDEIDLFELIKTVWDGRMLIVKTVVVFIFLGLFVALASNEEFTSQVKLMPESQQSSSGLGRLGGLASQFGISAGPQQAGEGIPPALYPDITQSNVFLERLMEYEVVLPGSRDRVTVKEYMSEHQNRSFVEVVRRYTIRLPFTLKSWITQRITRSNEDELNALDRELAGEDRLDRLVQMSREDWELLRNLRERISSEASPETGLVTVSVKMQDPVIAADLADRTVELLSEYISEYRTEKFRQDVNFIEERFEEARKRFEEAQQELARFNDNNRGQLTAMARTEEQLLQSRYNLTFNLYNTMAERLEEARIKLQEETPVVNILEPAAVPDRRSEPKRSMILIIYTILGGILGVGLIFGVQLWDTLIMRLNES